MIHETSIAEYDGTLVELAADLGDLQYDALAQFLRLLSEKISDDSNKDRQRSRLKLAAALERSAGHLAAAADEMDEVWRICEPYMSGRDISSHR